MDGSRTYSATRAGGSLVGADRGTVVGRRVDSEPVVTLARRSGRPRAFARRRFPVLALERRLRLRNHSWVVNDGDGNADRERGRHRSPNRRRAETRGDPPGPCRDATVPSNDRRLAVPVAPRDAADAETQSRFSRVALLAAATSRAPERCALCTACQALKRSPFRPSAGEIGRPQ